MPTSLHFLLTVEGSISAQLFTFLTDCGDGRISAPILAFLTNSGQGNTSAHLFAFAFLTTVV